MTQLPGIDPERATAYAACVQPHITLFLDDVEDFDYDSEYAGDWLPGFLRWVDPLAAPETARKLAEAEARIGELEKMRDLAIKSAMSVLESGIFCQSDWIGILETLEFDEADYHTYADGIWPP